MAERVRVKGITIHRPIIYGNTATVLAPEERQTLPHPDHTHRWTVAVRSASSDPESNIVGGADDIGYFIKRVSFKLHDTYPTPLRNIDKPPFEVTETGWGEFEVQIRITFIAEAGEKALVFYHHLKLHPWNLGTEPGEGPNLDEASKLGPVHSWQYDEIVFVDPFQQFLNTLTQHSPTPLPKIKRRPVPFHTSHPASLEASKGGVPEFNMLMEKEELERLDEARRSIMSEAMRVQSRLSERERELERLKRELGE
ncbi:yeats family protein [Amylostereum chailletii]|nr:yeats family protein [Amylostereum chailletii]